jgi:hypothetical protein
MIRGRRRGIHRRNGGVRRTIPRCDSFRYREHIMNRIQAVPGCFKTHLRSPGILHSAIEEILPSRYIRLGIWRIWGIHWVG